MTPLTGIGLTAYTALHGLAVIAPHNADVWSRALAPLHEPGPSWAPISLDPTATHLHPHSLESAISSPSKLSGRNVSSSASEAAKA